MKLEDYSPVNLSILQSNFKKFLNWSIFFGSFIILNPIQLLLLLLVTAGTSDGTFNIVLITIFILPFITSRIVFGVNFGNDIKKYKRNFYSTLIIQYIYFLIVWILIF